MSLGTSTTDATCYGINNGSATVTGIGGVPPYNYSWSNGQTTSTVTGLTVGTYSVTVTEAFGFSASTTIAINSLSVGPQTNNITGVIQAATGATETYSVSLTSGSSYSWTAANGNILSGQGTNTIQVQWGIGGTGQVSVIETNNQGCIGAAVYLLVQIGTGGGGVTGVTVFINEIHYENIGGDAGEGIEIAGTAGTDLSCYQLDLYNGNSNTVYNTITLSGTIPDQQCGYGTVWFDISGIQNGSPDGVSLYDTCNAIMIQFLSYEGTMTAQGGPADGLNSIDIGFNEDDANVGESLQLVGTGTQHGDFSWQTATVSSGAMVNTNQDFCVPTAVGCGTDSTQLALTINTVMYGYEISWSITDGTGAMVDTGTGYSSNSTYYETICIANCQTYQFNMYDSYGDGWNGGTYNLTAASTMAAIATGGLDSAYYGYDSFEYCTTSITKIESKEELNIYPNPFTQSTTIRFTNKEGSVFNMSISDITGNLVRVKEGIMDEKLIIEKLDLTPGLYFIDLYNDNRKIRGKMVLQ